MATPDLILTYLAGAAVRSARIVKLTADNTVVEAAGAAATEFQFGVSALIPDGAGGFRSTVSGQDVDVVVTGVASLVLGGAVARGAMVTSDANGAGVTAAPGAGVNNRVIGVALQTGVAGDVIDLLLAPGQIQG